MEYGHKQGPRSRVPGSATVSGSLPREISLQSSIHRSDSQSFISSNVSERQSGTLGYLADEQLPA